MHVWWQIILVWLIVMIGYLTGIGNIMWAIQCTCTYIWDNLCHPQILKNAQNCQKYILLSVSREAMHLQCLLTKYWTLCILLSGCLLIFGLSCFLLGVSSPLKKITKNCAFFWRYLINITSWNKVVLVDKGFCQLSGRCQSLHMHTKIIATPLINLPRCWSRLTKKAVLGSPGSDESLPLGRRSSSKFELGAWLEY